MTADVDVPVQPFGVTTCPHVGPRDLRASAIILASFWLGLVLLAGALEDVRIGGKGDDLYARRGSTCH